MSEAWIALGSNLGEREELLSRAVAHLAEAGVTPVEVSHLYETVPEGNVDEPLYLNAVLRAETELAPRPLLELMLEIERRLGRGENRSGPRTCDLDLLAWHDLILDEPGLRLPHPRLHLRAFVLVPLCEIDPNWRPPGFEESAADLLAKLVVVPGATRLHGPLELSEPTPAAYPWRHRAGMQARDASAGTGSPA